MHGNAKTAAVKKYAHLSGPELDKALAEDPKNLSAEDKAEIIAAIASGEDDGPKIPKGKKLYDKWMGEWLAVSTVTNPFDGRTLVLKWKFQRKGDKPNKTNIPLTDAQFELFNTTRRNESLNTPTEQLYPAGSIEDIVYSKPNPFQPVIVE